MKIEFDMTKQPPSADDLAEARRSATRTLERMKKLERSYRIAGAALFLGVIVALLVMASGFWTQTWVPDVVVGAAIAVCVSLGAIGMVGVRFADGLGAVVGGVLVPILGVATAVQLGFERAGEGAGMAVFISAGLVTITFAILNDRWIMKPESEANMVLNDLVELEASSMPEQCIEFMQLVDGYEEVKAYQHKLATMGRKPVVAEYEAAQLWVAEADKRQAEQETRDLAREACDRMAGGGAIHA